MIKQLMKEFYDGKRHSLGALTITIGGGFRKSTVQKALDQMVRDGLLVQSGSMWIIPESKRCTAKHNGKICGRYTEVTRCNLIHDDDKGGS